MDGSSKFALSLATKYFSVSEILTSRSYRVLLDNDAFDNYATEKEERSDTLVVFRGSDPEISRHLLRLSKDGIVYIRNAYEITARDAKPVIADIEKAMRLVARLQINGADVAFMDIKEEFVQSFATTLGPRVVYQKLLCDLLATLPSTSADSYVNVEMKRKLDESSAHVLTVRAREHGPKTVWSWFSGYALVEPSLWLGKSPIDVLLQSVAAYFSSDIHHNNVKMYELLTQLNVTQVPA